VTNLGTLPGGYESQANDINDQGLVSGFASNGILDPFSMLGWVTQARSFVWQSGVMQDIGTLGGPDAVSLTLNARGQISGQSYTNSIPNPTTGVPTTDVFLWKRGQMRDLGTLGGTVASPNWLSNSGKVAGFSTLAGDQTPHAFLWDGRRMIDLGTLGGDTSVANYLNDAGHVTGNADLPDGAHDAFLWANGQMHDLPPPSVQGAFCSNGHGINSRDDVVGNATDCQGDELAAVLWRHGVGYDLNTLIAPSALHLRTAEYISNRGEIFGVGTLPNGDQRVFMLVPNQEAGAASFHSTAARPLKAQARPATTLQSSHLLARGCAALPHVLAARLCGPQ
jgi:probable HAF family extracellular repeat protein